MTWSLLEFEPSFGASVEQKAALLEVVRVEMLISEVSTIAISSVSLDCGAECRPAHLLDQRKQIIEQVGAERRETGIAFLKSIKLYFSVV
ncbi:uncharacterized protein PHALS_14770 [Plasmopara halstedii]|uniref:Uncharacterized protein n=1 Tax=Plasmopara halstedii TaxID=4781 RepID=A0A0P1ARN9_PLAHL|nr:uncharacterized protein PHALS_14770 [Plasmopara halstedii]CEG44069.1 hypothetical protein PHALS_14770 [Plasmopara halstedii]|eukprot:XP_024580438.1 hypothetical protein PHALS_14770 [Plasmopara halstedii]